MEYLKRNNFKSKILHENFSRKVIISDRFEILEMPQTRSDDLVEDVAHVVLILDVRHVTEEIN